MISSFAILIVLLFKKSIYHCIRRNGIIFTNAWAIALEIYLYTCYRDVYLLLRNIFTDAWADAWLKIISKQISIAEGSFNWNYIQMGPSKEILRYGCWGAPFYTFSSWIHKSPPKGSNQQNRCRTASFVLSFSSFLSLFSREYYRFDTFNVRVFFVFVLSFDVSSFFAVVYVYLFTRSFIVRSLGSHSFS